MAVLVSPLQEPSRVVREYDRSRHGDGGHGEGRAAAAAAPFNDERQSELVIPEATLLAALRRIKHVLIGSTNRKIELAKDEESLAALLRLIQPNATHVARDSEVLAILAALSISRQECLAPLLALGMHHRIFTMMRSVDRDIQAASADTGGAGDGDGDGDGGSRSQRENLLYATMLAGVRTLRTFYSALVAYVDPLASDSFTYDMVVKSSLAKMEAMGTKLDLPFASTPTPSSNPRHQAAGPSSSKMQIVETTSKSTTMDFEDVASEVADSVFLGEEADFIMSLLYSFASRAFQRDRASHAGSERMEMDSEHSRKGVADVPSTSHGLDSLLKENMILARDVVKNLCQLIATCARSSKHRDAALQAVPTTPAGLSDPINLLFAIVQTSDLPSQTVEAIIAAMAALLKDETPAPGRRFILHLLAPPDNVPLTVLTARMTDKSPSMRLVAAECQVYLYKNLRSVGRASGWGRELGGAPITAVLLQLLSETNPSISARAGFVFAYFVSDDPNLQATAVNMDAFLRLKALLEQLSQPLEPYETVTAGKERSRQQQAALLAISALCTDSEDLRRKVTDSGLLSYIIDSLSSPFRNVRCAAAQCTRSLSRSINILKTALVDTNAAPALYRLLDPSEDPKAQLAAIAIMGNAFVEYSPLKKPLLELEGIVERVVALARPDRATLSLFATSSTLKGKRERDVTVTLLLRHHALTALKSMQYWGVSETKQRTVRCLTWEYIVALLRDPDVAIQTVTYGLLRNIACNHVNDIELVIRGIGEARLFALIEGALHSNNPALLLEHVLYLVVNIATGTDGHRAAIMNRHGIIGAIHSYLGHESVNIRVAAVWAVMNLCYKTEPGHQRSNENAAKLRTLGIETRLKELREDRSIEVRERVRDALESCFDTLDPLGHDMMMD